MAFLIASYQEPFEVAKMTFDCVRDIDYAGKKEIIVVDNSHNTESEDFKKWRCYVESFNKKGNKIETKFIYNKKREGLKPGNLDEAQKHIEQAEFVVILDVDSTLPLNKKLIEKSVAEFHQDKHLGFIQYKIVSTNAHFNRLTEALSFSQNMARFKRYATSYGGFCFFLGHNGIWRKTVLDKMGPWFEYYRGNIMIAEDILKSIPVYGFGFYGKSMKIATGEWTPCSLDALQNMWLRWTYGGAQVFFKYFRNIFSKSKFLFSEKIDELQHFISLWMNALVYPISIFLFLFLPQFCLNLIFLILYFIPAFIRMIISYRTYVKDVKMSIIKKIWYLYAAFFVVDSFILITQMKAVANFLLKKPQGWKITPKNIEEVPSWKSVILNRWPTVFFSFLLFAIVFVKWIVFLDFDLAALVNYFPIILMYLNILLCIILYDREGRKEYNDVHYTMIDTIQYLKTS